MKKILHELVGGLAFGTGIAVILVAANLLFGWR